MTPRERWPALLLQLHTDEWNRAIDIAQALGVSERTVYRDVQALMDTGVPIEGVPGKGYRLPEDYLLSPISLTTDEAVMLVLGSAYAAQNFDGRYQATARSARKKLENELSREDQERAVALQGSVHLVPPSVFGNPTEDLLLRQIRRALLDETTLHLDIGSSNGASSNGASSNGASPSGAPLDETDDTDAEAGAGAIRYNPYGLVRQGGTWYVVGYQHDRGRVRHIRLDAIRQITPTDERFERPSGYRTPPEGPESRPDRRVRVVFAAEVAPSVQVAPSLHVDDTERLADGRLVLSLRVDHELEVMPWLLSWGGHVRVLEPRALRRRLADEAHRVAAQYQDPPSLLDGRGRDEDPGA